MSDRFSHQLSHPLPTYSPINSSIRCQLSRTKDGKVSSETAGIKYRPRSAVIFLDDLVYMAKIVAFDPVSLPR